MNEMVNENLVERVKELKKQYHNALNYNELEKVVKDCFGLIDELIEIK